MTVLTQLASQLDRKDERPNKELAHELAGNINVQGIDQIIENLSNKNKKIQQDCIKVLYEIGRVKPELISDYTSIFIQLLKSRNNRMVWGAMQTLSTIAQHAPNVLIMDLKIILSAIKVGSVITVDKGILTLAKLATVSEENNEIIFPYLLNHLENCRTRVLPQHAESALLAVTEENKESFLEVLRARESYLTAPQLKRVKKIYKELEG